MIQAFGRCGDIKTAFALGKKVPGPVLTYPYLYFCSILIVDSLMSIFSYFQLMKWSPIDMSSHHQFTGMEKSIMIIIVVHYLCMDSNFWLSGKQMFFAL
jgi:hypothetical protein